MLVSRFSYRIALVVAIFVLVALRLFLWTSSDFSFRLRLGNNPKAWIYSGPEAEDKAVVMAKIQSDDVNWVFEHLPEYVAPERVLLFVVTSVLTRTATPVGSKQYTI